MWQPFDRPQTYTGAQVDILCKGAPTIGTTYGPQFDAILIGLAGIYWRRIRLPYDLTIISSTDKALAGVSSYAEVAFGVDSWVPNFVTVDGSGGSFWLSVKSSMVSNWRVYSDKEINGIMTVHELYALLG